MSGIVVVVGNPRTGSRTRLAGELVAERWAGPDDGPTTVIELADLGPALLEWGSDAAAAAVTTVLRADALVVASPTYKASFTGLLKLFLDQFDADALDDLPTVPLLTGGADVHRLAVDLHLTPVLLEIGASVPARGVWLSGPDVDHPEPAVDRWFTRHRDALTRALGPRPSPRPGSPPPEEA